MSEELDDRLKNHIANVFDNYEDDSTADEGWALLREKYPEEKKRRGGIWLWWGSAAALLLMVLVIGIWMNSNAPVDHLAQNKPAPQAKTMGSIQTYTSPSGKEKLTAHNSQTDSESSVVRASQPAVGDSQTSQNKPIENGSRLAVNKTRLNKTFNHRSVIRSYQTNIGKDQSKLVEAPENPTQNIALGPKKSQNNNQEPTMIDSAILANNKPQAQPKATNAETLKPGLKENKTPIFTALKPNNVEPNKIVDNKVKFGIYAATYINYSQGSDSRFNVGAGLSSEIKLAGNFKLITGLLVAQNSFDYKTAIPQTANNYIAESIAKTNKELIAAALPPAGPAAAPANPIIRDYQASLLALDIPVNLKYQFAKSDTYISAGISSGTYFSETYSFAYNYNSGYLAGNGQQNAQTKNSFNAFDFAKTLNLSFGTGYSIGKTRFIIEPFLKYPLGTMGSQNIKFGAGGVNLKLNLSPAKK